VKAGQIAEVIPRRKFVNVAFEHLPVNIRMAISKAEQQTRRQQGIAPPGIIAHSFDQAAALARNS
jgi:hypothetical protein